MTEAAGALAPPDPTSLDARIATLTEAVAAASDPSADLYVELGRALHEAGRLEDGHALMQAAVGRHAGDHRLWNLHGAFLRRLKKPAEAIESFDRAIALAPAELGPRMNRGSAWLDLGQGGEALAAFEALAAEGHDHPGLHLQLGRAYTILERYEPAEACLRRTVTLQPTNVDGWISLASVLEASENPSGLQGVLEEALVAVPDSARLAHAKVLALRNSRQSHAAETYLAEIGPKFGDEPWWHIQLADLIAPRDPERSHRHLRKAVELEPSVDNLCHLVQSLARNMGPNEGACLEEAYECARRAREAGKLTPYHQSILADVFMRVCAFEDLDSLGSFEELARSWANDSKAQGLFRLIGRVRTLEDRHELVRQHRTCRRRMEEEAASRPIRRKPRRAADGRIRVGFLSSDLRRHVVGYFALPLFDHYDRDRFEVYAYSSFQGNEDKLQRRFAASATAFRWMPQLSPSEIAQFVADDQLDILIELGGSTFMNKLAVMAWKPAPVQASWLGYPHSSGLAAIDHFICDPSNVPTEPGLLIESPLIMPKSWIALSQAVFTDDPAIDPTLPQDRAGALTFGTANNVHKYTPEVLALWARATAAVPGARFAFVRPEGAAEPFRRHVLAAFAAEGVAADRVIFHAVRGDHLRLYNEVDITLDTFPLTGGTTTVDALWMGVPVVSVRGPAFYERLSNSILTNAGLADHVADEAEGFLAIARALAADRAQRLDLRRTLRRRLRESPLGQAQAFARDFYAMLARAAAGS